jgi:hypothetical protein
LAGCEGGGQTQPPRLIAQPASPAASYTDPKPLDWQAETYKYKLSVVFFEPPGNVEKSTNNFGHPRRDATGGGVAEWGGARLTPQESSQRAHAQTHKGNRLKRYNVTFPQTRPQSFKSDAVDEDLDEALHDLCHEESMSSELHRGDVPLPDTTTSKSRISCTRTT